MDKPRVKKFLKQGLIGAGTIILFGGGFFLWLDGHCDRREKELNEAWGRVQIPLDTIPEKFPAVEDNASALALEERAALLGICMAPPARIGSPDCSRHLPAAAALGEFNAIKQGDGDSPGMGDYLSIQMEKPGPGFDPPTEKLRRYLKNHSKDIAALREQVLRDEPPRWGYDLQRDFAIQLPNVAGILLVQKVLLLDALDRLAAHDEAAAETDLGAVWKISAGLEANPTLIGQLIVIAARLMDLSALRKLHAPSAEWEARMAGYDPRGKVALAIETEIWVEQHALAVSSGPHLKTFLTDSGVLSDRSHRWLRFLPLPLLRRIARVSSLDASSLEQRRLDELLRLDPCESPAALLDARKDLQLPWWDILIGNSPATWNRANRATMHLEAARKLLALKTARNNSKNGRWPASLEGLQSSVCSDGKWSYFAYEDGTMSLTFNKPFQNSSLKFDKGINGTNYPINYREEPPAAAAKKSP